MRYLFLILTICALIILPCLAEKPPSGKARLASSAGEKVSSGYHAHTKRDPFKSLLLPKKEAAKNVGPLIPTFRPAGLKGILVSEVNVIGVASNHNARLAILQGKEKVSYFGKVGDKLYNGFISEINADKVIFVEEVVGPDGKKAQRPSIKRLYAEVEKMESAQQRRE